MNTQRIRYCLIGASLFLSLGGGVRLYRVIRAHTQDHFFAPHLLFASLSLYIAGKVLKMGLQNEEKTRKTAISLIRSGSVLAMIWGYRLFLLSKTSPETGLITLTILYVVMGTAIMCIGLSISRSLQIIQNGN